MFYRIYCFNCFFNKRRLISMKVCVKRHIFTTNLALSLDVCTLSSLLNNNVTSGETPSKRVFDNQAVYWRCKIFTHILSMQGLSGQGELWKAFFNKSKINCPFIILYRMIDCLYRINF